MRVILTCLREPEFCDRVQFFSTAREFERGGYRCVDRRRAARRDRPCAPRDRILRRSIRPAPMTSPSFPKPNSSTALKSTQAGAVLTSERLAQHAPKGVAVLRVRKPYDAFVTVVRKLYVGALRPTSVFATVGRVAGRHGASLGRARQQCHRRSVRGDRAVGENRRGHPDRRPCSDRPGCSDRQRLRDRQSLLDHPCPCRRSRHHSSRMRHRAGRLRLSEQRRRDIPRFRKSAASSLAMTSRSAPARASTAAASATPSSAKAPRSIICARSGTTASSAAIASSSRNAGSAAA